MQNILYKFTFWLTKMWHTPTDPIVLGNASTAERAIRTLSVAFLKTCFGRGSPRTIIQILPVNSLPVTMIPVRRMWVETKSAKATIAQAKTGYDQTIVRSLITLGGESSMLQRKWYEIPKSSTNERTFPSITLLLLSIGVTEAWYVSR